VVVAIIVATVAETAMTHAAGVVIMIETTILAVIEMIAILADAVKTGILVYVGAAAKI
jgi:hypothetical protein